MWINIGAAIVMHDLPVAFGRRLKNELAWGRDDRDGQQGKQQQKAHARESAQPGPAFHFFVFIRANRAQVARNDH